MVDVSQSGPELELRLSVVTVCRNRREHLLRTAAELSRWPHHQEHLILDWSSTVPLSRNELPEDPRLRLVRIEGEKQWNLCRAYNFAISQAEGTRILKLDADSWPGAEFDPSHEALLKEGCGNRPLACALGSGQGGRKGQFLIDRALLAEVGGFNEYLVGYGFDDKDLQARLTQALGVEPARIPADWLEVIPHSDEERAERLKALGPLWLLRSEGFAAMRASRLANRLLVAYHPWGKRSPASRYRELHAGVWKVDPASVPRPAAETALAIDHARRMTFWGHFLAIPEIALEQLPYALFPAPRQGRWPVRWWHRLYWWTGRPLLQLPVLAVVAGRKALLSLQQRPAHP